MVKKRGCRGQMKMSFGMIFSIILIVIFLAFAFYAITKFLEFQDGLKIEKFFDDLQADVDKTWAGAESSDIREYSLPKKITSVCFTDDEYENLFFQSENIIRGTNIEHIDIETITNNGKDDPFCILNENTKIQMTIKKDFEEILVTITK